MVHKPHAIELFTVGHSTRGIEEFVELIRAYEIRRVVDIRTIPRSRQNPQFNHQDFSRVLHNRRIHYRHMKLLGGLRRTNKDSPNTGWRNASFRGYADYMQTPDFERGLNELMRIAREELTVIMCAEAVPWRCHRSLVADALLVQGIKVFHIFSRTRATPHTLTSFLTIEGERLLYPEPAPS